MKSDSKWASEQKGILSKFWWPGDEKKLASHELKSPQIIKNEPLKAVTANLVNSSTKTHDMLFGVT